MLHFAYGSNMYRALMRKHAPAAEPIGVAQLANYRFIITGDGYASVKPIPVHCNGSLHAALVYIARPRPLGRPKPGYMEIVVKAARELELPEGYVASLEQWLPKRALGAGHRKIGDFV
jgi:hypothetical protein